MPGQDLPPRPLTWARLPRPCGDRVGCTPQAGPAHPRQKRLCTWFSWGNRGSGLSGPAGVTAHRLSGQQDLASHPRVQGGTLLLLIHVAAAPLPFRPKVPGDCMTAAPGQGSGSREEGSASAIQPSMLLPQPLDLPEALSALAPPFSRAQTPADLPACPGDGPRPCVHLGPLIRNGWGAPMGGEEARSRDREGERRPRHVRASPPALLPHSVAPGAGGAQPGASSSPV